MTHCAYTNRSQYFFFFSIVIVYLLSLKETVSLESFTNLWDLTSKHGFLSIKSSSYVMSVIRILLTFCLFLLRVLSLSSMEFRYKYS